MAEHAGGVDFAAKAERLAATHLATPEARPATTARGIHHLALICSDPDRTMAFYQGVLGWPLIEIMENRDYPGSAHFFHDLGNGNYLAFFDFPGLALPEWQETLGSMQHVAVSVTPDGFYALRARLDHYGVEYMGATEEIPTSIYFRGPDNEQIEILSDDLRTMGGERLGA